MKYLKFFLKKPLQASVIVPTLILVEQGLVEQGMTSIIWKGAAVVTWDEQFYYYNPLIKRLLWNPCLVINDYKTTHCPA